MNTAPPIARDELLRYVEGEVTTARHQEIEAQLEWCPVSQERLQGLRELTHDIGAPDPDLAAIDLLPDLHLAMDSEPAIALPQPRRPRRWAIGGGAAAITALAAGLLIYVSSNAPEDEAVRLKSAGTATAERWAGIQAWRVAEDGNAVAVDSELQAEDALLFSYTNIGPEPFSHMMIFAVDSEGAVHWYYPAHTDPGRDPSSIPIVGGQSRVELPEQVRHDLATGPLRIYGLFSREALRVSAVESEVARLHARGAFAADTEVRLGFDHSAQHILELEVQR